MRQLMSRLMAISTVAFAIGIITPIAIVSWFGYRGITEWRTGTTSLAERRTTEAANLLLQALRRDMNGAQSTMLTPLELGALSPDRSAETANTAAVAFAGYPY